MKFSKNEKGMTLIEIIVATAVFGIACATLFTAILFAIKQNKENYYAGNEIQMQMNSAERFNSKKTLIDNKVLKYRFSDTHSNKVSYTVSFSKTHDGTVTGHNFELEDNKVYAYMAIKGTNDRAATYQMRFFESEDAKLVDPDNGKFWIRFYNYSSTDLPRTITVNEAKGLTLYGVDGESIAQEVNQDALSSTVGTASLQVGFDKSKMASDADEYVVIGGHANEYFKNPDYTLVSGDDFMLNESNFDKYCEMQEGKYTGYIDIYYDGTGYYSAEEMEAKDPGSTGL